MNSIEYHSPNFSHQHLHAINDKKVKAKLNKTQIERERKKKKIHPLLQYYVIYVFIIYILLCVIIYLFIIKDLRFENENNFTIFIMYYKLSSFFLVQNHELFIRDYLNMNYSEANSNELNFLFLSFCSFAQNVILVGGSFLIVNFSPSFFSFIPN